MVSTRSHPTAFPPPEPSPIKAPSPEKALRAPRSRASLSPSPNFAMQTRSKGRAWTHTPTNSTLAWIAIQSPLVLWDSFYILCRPHSMPGGSLHMLWAPYTLYSRVDRVYGLNAFHTGDGFPLAQTLMNVVELTMYLTYMWIVYTHGVATPVEHAPNGAALNGAASTVATAAKPKRQVRGKWAAHAVMIAFTAATMTMSKTVLYWIAYLKDVIADNTLVLTWAFWAPLNSPWIIFPLYIMYELWNAVADGLVGSVEDEKKAR